jgi:DNA-binding NarL/FixJ family response regulator
MSGSVRVLAVDDQRPFRVAAAAVLRRTPGFELVGEASSGEEAVAQVGALGPDLVLMDISMPGMGGIEAARVITAAEAAPVVLLCSTYQREDLPPAAADCGAAGYVHKEELSADLLLQLWAAAQQRQTGADSAQFSAVEGQ